MQFDIIFGRIDVVLNNVGVNDGAGLDAFHEAFMNSLKLNMVSYFWIVKQALPWAEEGVRWIALEKIF